MAFRNEGQRLPPEAMGTDIAPSLRGWQAIKEQLDDVEGSLRRAGKNKAANNTKALRKRLLSELDEQNPDYAEARKLWAGTMEFEELMDQGRRFCKARGHVANPKGWSEEVLTFISGKNFNCGINGDAEKI